MSLPTLSTDVSFDVGLARNPGSEAGLLAYFSGPPSQLLSEGDVTSGDGAGDSAVSEEQSPPELEPDYPLASVG